MNVLAHEHEVAVIGTTFSHHTIHGLQLPIDVKAREQLLIGECGRILEDTGIGSGFSFSGLTKSYENSGTSGYSGDCIVDVHVDLRDVRMNGLITFFINVRKSASVLAVKLCALQVFYLYDYGAERLKMLSAD